MFGPSGDQMSKSLNLAKQHVQAAAKVKIKETKKRLVAQVKELRKALKQIVVHLERIEVELMD
jgi:hypothetical protein